MCEYAAANNVRKRERITAAGDNGGDDGGDHDDDRDGDLTRSATLTTAALIAVVKLAWLGFSGGLHFR
jgi:hypothetical protein